VRRQAAIHPQPIVEFRARIRLRSQLQLGVAQLEMKITTSGRREVEHISERIEGIVVAILLARLGRHVKDFRTPEMTDRFSVAVEYVEHRHVPFLTRFEFLLHANVDRQTRRVHTT
jgi:hypothetical protein